MHIYHISRKKLKCYKEPNSPAIWDSKIKKHLQIVTSKKFLKVGTKLVIQYSSWNEGRFSKVDVCRDNDGTFIFFFFEKKTMMVLKQ